MSVSNVAGDYPALNYLSRSGCPYCTKQHHTSKLVEKLVLFCILKTQGRYFVERRGSGVKLRTLDYENPGSNIVLQC